MFLPEMFPQCQFWIISTVFCPKWQLFAGWIVQQFRRDTAYSGWNMVNARENATNGCFPNPYFWRIATTAFHSSWECFRYIFATWTRRPVPLSSCAKRRNNRDKLGPLQAKTRSEQHKHGWQRGKNGAKLEISTIQWSVSPHEFWMRFWQNSLLKSGKKMGQSTNQIRFALRRHHSTGISAEKLCGIHH